jgi:hypothetical protein
MSGTPGAEIATTGTQPPIGAFVQDTVHPNGATGFIGCNPEIAYDTNEMNIPLATVCSTDYGTALTSTGSKDAVYCSSAVVLVPTDKVTVSAGVATKDNSTGTHLVFANVPAAGFFWAVPV